MIQFGAEEIIPIPNLSHPQHLFTLISSTLGQLHDNARKQLLEGIMADSALTPHSALLESMEKDNEEELRKLNERLAEAEKQEGESEISDALKARTDHLTQIGDKEGAVAAQKFALVKTPGLGSRIDMVLTLIRLGFFFGDNGLITENLPKAKRFIQEGGDWDRRNRLKVYRGLRMISIRQLKAGSALLLDALSTFIATELDYFPLLIIFSVAHYRTRGYLRFARNSDPWRLLNNLYDCHYAKFFIALPTLGQTYLLPLRLLLPHTCYYVREMRILAYNQLLESYCSLTLESLSGAFGVGVGIEFVHSELSWFIANGHLHCTIDRVHGIVETISLKNAQYDKVIKQGDVLLNSVRRFSKAPH
ncbi:26S proteasome subunit RPN7-domain-containing protein [Suillus plorans]|uniref:26S proteasome subunit RPN7-domain-containing protein n=1 Tax=Suillus plorans TaxID=116603 RepID=A0A9P7DDR7_9AGAM|nr:26S proteasome subunit RPN7-domain-containing protein [Suillus plorans]KAG1789320.1 26S proteasome subunit RPN7-domain-containing protein [Suillus plorans]